MQFRSRLEGMWRSRRSCDSRAAKKNFGIACASGERVYQVLTALGGLLAWRVVAACFDSDVLLG